MTIVGIVNGLFCFVWVAISTLLTVVSGFAIYLSRRIALAVAFPVPSSHPAVPKCSAQQESKS